MSHWEEGLHPHACVLASTEAVSVRSVWGLEQQSIFSALPAYPGPQGRAGEGREGLTPMFDRTGREGGMEGRRDLELLLLL